MPRGKLWNQVPLIEAFSAYKRDQLTADDIDIIEAPVTPRHVDDLVNGARALLRQKSVRAKEQVTEYAFSDEAINSVRRGDAYIGNPTIGKERLKLASITRLSDGGFLFARLFDTKLSIMEAVMRSELDHIRAEYPDDEQEGAPIIPTFEAQIEIASALESGEHDFLRKTNVLYPGSPIDTEGDTIEMYPDGSTQRRAAELVVVDYMTLGHLIEFDKR